MKSILLTILLCCSCTAAELVVSAPETVNAGDLFVISWTGSTGDFYAQVVDPRLDGKVGTCGEQLFCSTSTPGIYRFSLAASDSEGLDIQAIEVNVVGSVTTPPDQPPKPKPPTKPSDPVPDLDGLRELVEKETAKVGDLTTQKKLAATLVAIEGKESLKETRSAVQQAISTVLLMREGESREKDWLSWREAISKHVEKLNPTTVEQYIAIVKEISAGLSLNAFSSTPQLPLLIVESGKNCTYCTVWEREDRPKITRFKVLYRDPKPNVLIPNFTIVRPGLPDIVLKGYRTHAQLESYLN